MRCGLHRGSADVHAGPPRLQRFEVAGRPAASVVQTQRHARQGRGAGLRGTGLGGPVGSDALDEHRHTLAHADAQRGETALSPLPSIRPSSVTISRAPEQPSGWAERDRAPVGVDDLGVEAQPTDARDRLRREGLVELRRADVVDTPADPGQRLLRRRTGPSPISDGRTPALAEVTIRARGVRPCASTAASLATTIAAAPSDKGDDEPAVTMPSGRNAGLEPGHRLHAGVGRMPSSVSKDPVFVSTATISSVNRPVLGRCSGALVRAESPGVGLLAGDAPSGCC